jgi:hypothetical protein
MAKISLIGFVLSVLTFCARAESTTSTTGRDHAWLIFNSGASGVLDTETNPALSVEYRFSEQWAHLHPWLGLGWATDGALFAGGGVAYTADLSPAWSASVGFGPGYYERHQGADLGSHLEFYSFAELSYALRWGDRVSLRFAHISNGGIEEKNPGTELLTVGYAIRLP